MDPQQVETTKTKVYELADRLSSHTFDTPKYETKRDYIVYVLRKIAAFTSDSYYETCPYCTTNELPTILKLQGKPITNELLDLLFARILRYTKENILKSKLYNQTDINILNYYDTNSDLTEREQTDSVLIKNTFDSYTVLT